MSLYTNVVDVYRLVQDGEVGKDAYGAEPVIINLNCAIHAKDDDQVLIMENPNQNTFDMFIETIQNVKIGDKVVDENGRIYKVDNQMKYQDPTGTLLNSHEIILLSDKQ